MKQKLKGEIVSQQYCRLQYPTFNDRRIREKTRKQESQHNKQTRSNRHIQNTLRNNRIRILLKYTWGILQDGPYVHHKLSLNRFKTMNIIKKFSLNTTKKPVTEHQKTQKLVEIEHTLKQLMEQNHKKNQNTLRNKYENIAYQNLLDAAKAVLRGKCTAINAYIEKHKKPQINNLTLLFKEQEKE